MSNPPMYGDLLPLDREIHKNLKLDKIGRAHV